MDKNEMHPFNPSELSEETYNNIAEYVAKRMFEMAMQRIQFEIDTRRKTTDHDDTY